MLRRLTLLINILFVLALALSGAFVGDPSPTESSAAEEASRERSPNGAPLNKQASGKQDHKSTSQAEEQVQIRAGKWRQFCTSPESVRLQQVELCTHGPDEGPAGFTSDEPMPLIPTEAASQQTPGVVVCEGDGQSGYRVQVLYVRADDVLDNYLLSLAPIQAAAARADLIFQQSAIETGGSRSLRFAHDGSCQPTVQEVVVSSVGDDHYQNTFNELRSLNRTDRIYLAFVDLADDNSSAGICGVGTLWDDDSANSSANWNNFGPSYSLIYCWSGWVAAHELMHNLGGVQLSAPNSSGGFHCVDEYDVMCYSDYPYSPAMRYDCNLPALDGTQLDCNHNDYYHTGPSAGSYLARCWNTANNQFLIGATPQSSGAPCTPDPPPIGEDKKDKKKDNNKKGGGKKGNGNDNKKGGGKKGGGKKGNNKH